MGFKHVISFSWIVVQVMAEVKETSQDYSCTGDLHHVESEYAMKNPDCDHYWSYQDHSIGTYLYSTPECHNPCKELTAGKIVLTDCVNITLAVICTKVENSWTTETRVHFYGKTISQSPLNSEKRAYIAAFSSFGALMFIICLLGAGWLHYKNKNNVQESDVTNERRLTFDTDC